MNRLQERLHRLKKAPESPKTTEEPFVHAPEDDWSQLQATLYENEMGCFVRRVIRHSLANKHGHIALEQLVKTAPALSAISANQTDVTCENMLFFDTETTGLGIGAGNVPFMLGFGYFRDDEFVIEQCVMRNPGDEPAMLHYFQGVLAQYTHLVTYNGRTFDWPVLKNRFIMNRMSLDDVHIAHMDFLYPARSLWRRVLPSCSLGTVEGERLGVNREDDVPGSMAPTLYLQYLSSGDASPLEGVFRHNEADLLSLAGLATLLSGVLLGSLTLTRMSSEEVLRLGMWFDKLGRTQLADQAYDELLKRPTPSIRTQLLTLADIMKRRRRYQDAVRLWQETVKQGVLRSEPYIELAMYYEHHAKDFACALNYAEQAKEHVLRRRTMAGPISAKQREALSEIDRRIARLQRKLDAAAADVDAAQLYAGDLFIDHEVTL